MAAVPNPSVLPPTKPTPTHPVERFFTALGVAIQSAVGSEREQVYAQLATVAVAELQAFNPSAHIGQADLIDYVLGADKLCRQADLDGKFAEPPLSLYRGEHFDISALTWLDGTTSTPSPEIRGQTGISKRIGEEVSDRLAMVPGHFFIKRTVRPKYADPRLPENGVACAPLPAVARTGCSPAANAAARPPASSTP